MESLGGGGAIPATGPVIRVPYDRTQRTYLDIATEPLELPVQISARCTSSTFLGMSIEVGGTELPVDGSGLSKGNGGFSGRKTITSNALTTRVLDTAEVPDPIATCKSDLRALVTSGEQGKAQKGWARRYDNALRATLTVRCKGAATKDGVWEKPAPTYVAEATTRFHVWIHCGPAAVFATGTGTQPTARRSSDVTPAKEPQRVRGEPQRVASEPQRVADPPAEVGDDQQMASPLPDLMIADARLAPTAPTKLRVQVSNKGTLVSDATTLTLFFERAGTVRRAPADVPSLAPDESRWVIVDAGEDLALADHLTLRVDDPASVPELDETNNSFTVK
jgi:hypothetical protein